MQELRASLRAGQRALLGLFWDHYIEAGEWPKSFDTHRSYTKQYVIDCLTPLCGDIVFETDDSRGTQYQLTLIGALLTPGGEHYFQLLVRFLEFLHDKYLEPRRTKTSNNVPLHFTDEVIAKALELSDNDRILLGKLSYLDRDFRTDNRDKGHWAITVPNAIEDVPETRPLDAYRENLLFRHFNRTGPVFRRNQWQSSPSSSLTSIFDPFSPFKSSAPPEIADSIKRFTKEHPDPSKAAFIMMRFGTTNAHEEIVTSIRAELDKHGIKAIRADDKDYHDDLYWNIFTIIFGCGFGIAVFERLETQEFNPNIALEVGCMLTLKKPVLLLKDKTLTSLNTDLIGKLYKEFDTQKISETVGPRVQRWLKDRGLIQHAR